MTTLNQIPLTFYGSANEINRTSQYNEEHKSPSKREDLSQGKFSKTNPE